METEPGLFDRRGRLARSWAPSGLLKEGIYSKVVMI